MLGIDWGRAPKVEAPDNYNGDAKQPPYKGDHPILRIPGQAIMADVSAIPGGGFVVAGYVPPTWVPAAWTSADGLTWALHPMGTTEFTFAVSVAVASDGAMVAVGRTGKLPLAWTSTDGATWVEHPVAILGDGAIAERMTTVIATKQGWLAGGSIGPELQDRHARFWTSSNGVEWVPVPDDADAFADAEVRSIAPYGDGFVAVGAVGSVQHPTGAVAWTSPDGVRWTRVDDPDFVDGVAVSVTAAPFGGLVAVGSAHARQEAAAWTSADGRDWTKAPSDPGLTDPSFVWMTDVVAIGDTVIATGGYQALQRGTATSWVSHDGLHWTRSNSAPVQEQGEFYSIAPRGDGAVAVGSFGQPDSYAPRAWVTPAR